MADFKCKFLLIEAKWKSWDLNNFAAYFRKQWVDSQFNKWGVFNTPIGYSSTNNPIESYNNTIKRFFTNRVRLNVVTALERFEEAVKFESNTNNKFQTVKIVTPTLVTKSKKLELNKFKKIGDNYIYAHKNGSKSYIDVVNKVCSCKVMSDKGICEHLVRVAIIEDIYLLGLVTKHKLTVRPTRSKNPKKVDLEVSVDEDFNNAMNGVEVVETLNEVNEKIVNENVTEYENDVNESFLNSIDDTNIFYVNPPPIGSQIYLNVLP